jgi:flagellar motor switch protein FliN/FliY
MAPILAETLRQFWGLEVQLTFFAVSDTMHYFWRLDDFHVSQLTLDTAQSGLEPATALLRLSDGACSALLTRVMGPRKTGFSFKQISPLEATVLNEFSRDLLAHFKKQLLRKPGKHHSNDTLHLMWVFTLEETSVLYQTTQQYQVALDLGKIILSIPLDAIRLKPYPYASDSSQAMVPDAFFFQAKGQARIFLGTTRVALADLEQLEPEDVIVLENSHANTMFVIEPESGERIPFQSEIRQKQRLTIPYTQELAMMDTQQQSTISAKQALWDNLMIEVGAEFEPIKLPLKQIKQMTEGLVIEMGDLVHNRIRLQVEDKVLAWGELIIVGDKFGVRICQVAANQSLDGQSDMDQGALATLGPSPSVDQSAAQPMEEPSAEEENLDNFLNEDFDDTFEDDEEDW